MDRWSFIRCHCWLSLLAGDCCFWGLKAVTHCCLSLESRHHLKWPLGGQSPLESLCLALCWTMPPLLFFAWPPRQGVCISVETAWWRVLERHSPAESRAIGPAAPPALWISAARWERHGHCAVEPSEKRHWYQEKKLTRTLAQWLHLLLLPTGSSFVKPAGILRFSRAPLRCSSLMRSSIIGVSIPLAGALSHFWHQCSKDTRVRLFFGSMLFIGARQYKLQTDTKQGKGSGILYSDRGYKANHSPCIFLWDECCLLFN